MEISDEVLESIVSQCNGSTSNALSHLYTLVALNDTSINPANSPKSELSPPNSNNKVGNIVLASLVTSVVKMPKSPTSLSTTLSDIKAALNIKPKQTSNGVKQQQNKNLGKRPGKLECSTAVPDSKRFLSTSLQKSQINNVDQKVNLQHIKQEINGDLLKLCPVKYIPITTNGTTQPLPVATSIPTPLFVTQPLSPPPLSDKSADKTNSEQKTVKSNGSANPQESQQMINIGATALQNDQGYLIWNLYFYMLTGNPDSALVVLSSLLQNGVKSTTIAQELVSFSALYIGNYRTYTYYGIIRKLGLFVIA